jgi:WD40 repeat protein
MTGGRLNYTLGQLLLVVVMAANVCGVIVVLRGEQRELPRIVTARFSGDGKIFVADLEDDRVVTCDAATGKIINSVERNWPRFCFDRHLAADGNTWAAVQSDGRIEFGQFRPAKRWDAEVPPTLRPLLWPYQRSAISDNGATFAVKYTSARRPPSFHVALWDVASGRLLRTLDVRAEIRDIFLTPDGKTAVVETVNSLHYTLDFWDVASGQRHRSATVPNHGEVAETAWDAGETLLWTSGWDENLRWPGQHPAVVAARICNGRQERLELDDSWKNCGDSRNDFGDLKPLLVSADRRTILVSNERNRVQFLDAATLKPLAEPSSVPDSNEPGVYDRGRRATLLGLSADGKELATTGYGESLLRVRMFDRQGRFSRELVLLSKRGPVMVAATLAINFLVFIVCAWLLAMIRRRVWRKAKYSAAELQRLKQAEERLP